MKKVLIGLFLFLVGCLPSFSSSTYVMVDNEYSITMDNFWFKNGRYEEKIIRVASKLLNDNAIDKRVPIMFARDKKINAYSYPFNKTICVHLGILPYIDSDDELAFLIGHEISHSLDAYAGLPAWISYIFNSKHYEYKSDLRSIDFMVKAGYDPIAAITFENKFFPEAQWDFGFWFTHPKTSKRLMKIYKHIREKYPWALNSKMTKNIHYVNFKRSMERDIKDFERKRLEKLEKQKRKEQKKKAKENI